MAKKVFIALFVVILAIPGVCFAFSEKSGEMPKFAEEGGLNTSFSTEWEEYFDSSLNIKDAVLTVNGAVKSKVFASETANVVTGKGGYLFYGETSGDYLGADVMSAREVYSTAKTLELIEEYCNGAGVNFTFAAVPNKNSVLGEYMPYNFIKGENKNLTSIYACLEEMGVNTADVYGAVSACDNTQELYYKTDSHWNSFGAYIGFKEIINSLGETEPKLLQNLGAADFEKGSSHVTDLSSMLMSKNSTAEDDVQVKNYESLISSFSVKIRGAVTNDTEELLRQINDKDEDISLISTAGTSPEAKGQLFMLRDSFCRAMLPYFAYTYEGAEFVKSAAVNAYIYDLSEYNDFVFEIIERNLGNIVQNRQLFPAPERNLEIENESLSEESSIEVSTEYADYVMISGKIDSGCLGDASNIYVALTNAKTGERHVYEALPGEIDENGAQGYYMTLCPTEPAEYAVKLVIDDTVIAESNISF